MALREIKFSPDRSVEAIIYVASKLANPTIHEVLKLRYFADKLHLAKFGFLASGDDYVAMQFGPVASSTYNILKAARGDQTGWLHPRFYDLVSGSLSIGEDRKSVILLRGANTDLLSRAELSCLDEAVQTYGGMSFKQRTKLSHDSAWEAAYKIAEEDEVGQSPISLEAIAQTLTNAPEVISHLRAQ